MDETPQSVAADIDATIARIRSRVNAALNLLAMYRRGYMDAVDATAQAEAHRRREAVLDQQSPYGQWRTFYRK